MTYVTKIGLLGAEELHPYFHPSVHPTRLCLAHMCKNIIVKSNILFSFRDTLSKILFSVAEPFIQHTYITLTNKIYIDVKYTK